MRLIQIRFNYVVNVFPFGKKVFLTTLNVRIFFFPTQRYATVTEKL